MTDLKLKPCPVPWCIGDPQLITDEGHPHPYSIECVSCDVAGPRADTPEVAARNWNYRAQTFTWFPVSHVFPPQQERLLVAMKDPSVFGGRGWRDGYVNDRGEWRDCHNNTPLHRPGVDEVTHWARVPMPEDD